MQHLAVQDLAAAWGDLISRHSHDPDALAVGGELVAAWSQPHRRYHSVAHLMDILVRVEQLADHADDPDAVRLAAWYHDCVYEGLPDDEERSARRAEEDLSRLGVAPAMVDEVARLVRMTVTHDPAPGDHNGEVLSDADLAALALPRDLYRMNSAAITAEVKRGELRKFYIKQVETGDPGDFARKSDEELDQYIASETEQLAVSPNRKRMNGRVNGNGRADH